MPSKRIKVGLKMYMLIDSETTYVLNNSFIVSNEGSGFT